MKEEKTLLDKSKTNYKAAKLLMQNADDELLLCLVGYHLQQAVEIAIGYQLRINEAFDISFWERDLDQVIRLAREKNIGIYMTDYIYDHSEMFAAWKDKASAADYSIERRKIEKAMPEVERYLEGCEQYIKENLVFSEENEQEGNNNIEIGEDRDDR